jgi:hypothetical protein
MYNHAQRLTDRRAAVDLGGVGLTRPYGPTGSSMACAIARGASTGALAESLDLLCRLSCSDLMENVPVKGLYRMPRSAVPSLPFVKRAACFWLEEASAVELLEAMLQTLLLAYGATCTCQVGW